MAESVLLQQIAQDIRVMKIGIEELKDLLPPQESKIKNSFIQKVESIHSAMTTGKGKKFKSAEEMNEWMRNL